MIRYQTGPSRDWIKTSHSVRRSIWFRITWFCHPDEKLISSSLGRIVSYKPWLWLYTRFFPNPYVWGLPLMLLCASWTLIALRLAGLVLITWKRGFYPRLPQHSLVLFQSVQPISLNQWTLSIPTSAWTHWALTRFPSKWSKRKRKLSKQTWSRLPIRKEEVTIFRSIFGYDFDQYYPINKIRS